MIEENNEIKDILLDKEEYKSGKTKKVLIIVAIFVLLFIIVIIGVKVVSGSKNNKSTNQPVATLLPKSANNSKKSSDNFEQVPIENQNQLDFDKMVQNLKAKEKLNDTQPPIPPQTTNQNMQKDSVTPSVVKTQDSFKQVPPATPVAKPVAKPVQRPVAVPVKKPVEKSIAKLFKQETTSSIKPVNSIEKGIYVQVSSIVKIDPTSMLFKKLKADNYRYRIYATKARNRTIYKVLVGPYNKSEFETALKRIRANIKNDAFLFIAR